MGSRGAHRTGPPGSAGVSEPEMFRRSWQGPAQCIRAIFGQRRAQKGAVLLESASVIRRPGRTSLAPARSTRSRRRRRLQPVPVARAMARRAMCIS